MRKRTISTAVVLALAVVACGGGRSVEAFCDTYNQETERLAAKYEARADALDGTEDPLLGLLGYVGMAFEGFGDAVVLFERLEGVAPEEIRPEVSVVRDGLQKQIDAAGGSVTDPFGGLASGLISGLTLQGPMSAVDTYIAQNCSG